MNAAIAPPANNLPEKKEETPGVEHAECQMVLVYAHSKLDVFQQMQVRLHHMVILVHFFLSYCRRTTRITGRQELTLILKTDCPPPLPCMRWFASYVSESMDKKSSRLSSTSC
jgi:hypothetical protein